MTPSPKIVHVLENHIQARDQHQGNASAEQDAKTEAYGHRNKELGLETSLQEDRGQTGKCRE